MRHTSFQFKAVLAKPACRSLLTLFVLGLLGSNLAIAADLDAARDLLNKGHYDAAALEANDYLAEHPGDTHARFIRGLALARSGQVDAAISLFRELAEEYPDLAEPLNNLGVLYAQQGQFAQASDVLEKAIKINPDHGPAQENLGDVYVALARDAFEKAASLEQNNTAVRQKRARLQALLDAPRGEEYVNAQPDSAGETTSDTQTNTLAAPAVEPSGVPQSGQAQGNTKTPIEQAATRWARAWSNQNIDAYLNAYSADFAPESGQSRAQWARERTQRVVAPNTIEVELSDFNVQVLSSDRSIISFMQRYRSDNYRDQERKALLMYKEGAGWKILREGAPGAVQTYANSSPQPDTTASRAETPQTQASGSVMGNASSAGSQQAVRGLVRAWAQAWSGQDLNGYFAVYSDQFDPEDSQSLAAWIRERQERVSSPDSISVSVTNLRVENTGSDTAEAKFMQRYESGSYSDLTAKTLRLRREAEGWRIVQEISE